MRQAPRATATCLAVTAILLATLAMAVPVADAAYVDVTRHALAGVPGGGILLDQIAPGPFSLAPGAPGRAFYAPAAPAGGSCISARNFIAAATACRVDDTVFLPAIGWHGEFVIHNPRAVAITFNAAFFDGWGNVYAGRATLGGDSSLYVDLHLADIPEQAGLETGRTSQFAVWRDPFGRRAMDVSFSTFEDGGAVPLPVLVPCPIRRATIQGPTPTGEFACRFAFLSSPEDAWVFTAADDPTLPSFGLNDPGALADFDDVRNAIPAPTALGLLALGSGLAAVQRLLARRRPR